MAKLIDRKGVYYVRYFVPKTLQPIAGRTEVWRSTKTGDLREAEQRKHKIIVEIQNELEHEARAAQSNPKAVGWVQLAAAELRQRVESGELNSDDAGELLSAIIDDHLTARKLDADDLTPSHLRSLRSSSRLVTDLTTLPLNKAIDQHLAEKADRVNPSTLSRQRGILEAFDAWAGQPILTDVTRRLAVQWVSEVLLPEDLTPKTKNIRLSVLSSLFNWAIRRGLYEQANPWAGMGADVKGSSRGSNGKRRRRAWTPAELEKLREIPEDDPLYAVARLSLYAGLRTEEACCLKVADVDLKDDYLIVDEGKTESALRQVPLHANLQPVVERLVENAEDEYLVPGLVRGGPDDRRSYRLVKRASPWIRKHVSKDPKVVLYSLRHTFATALENAGVAKLMIQRLQGHSFGELTFSTYSSGPELEARREAIATLPFTV